MDIIAGSSACGPSRPRLKNSLPQRSGSGHTEATVGTQSGRRRSKLFALRDFLFDHLVGDGEYAGGNVETKRSSRRLPMELFAVSPPY
jgi:hypothetical protein